MIRPALLLFVVSVAAGCGADPPSTGPSPQLGNSGASSVPAGSSRDAAEVADFVFGRTGLSRERQADSLALFDGESLFGWEATPEVSVADGMLQIGGETGRATTFVPFADFRLVSRIEIEPESGLTIAVRSDRDDDRPNGHSLTLTTIEPRPLGADEAGLQVISQVAPAQPHEIEAVCDGGLVRFLVNGDEVGDAMELAGDGVPDAGSITLTGAGTSRVRSLHLTPLNAESALSASLEGWQASGEIDVTEVDDGVRIVGGLGFVVSKATYGDFLLQADVVVNSPTTNSGVFFRAMQPSQPTESNGYEMQVSAEYDGDRTQPVDAGAGAIFRRAEARRVLLDPGVPTTLTLVAAGDRFMTWVAGYPVATFRDERPDDPNPRRGRRLEAGHLLLQGHDPGTDVTFRSLAIQTYPTR